MGGFVTDETGKVVMHISSPDILTQESIDFWEKEYGIELRCDICNVRLQPGDQKDPSRRVVKRRGPEAGQGGMRHVRNQIALLLGADV